MRLGDVDYCCFFVVLEYILPVRDASILTLCIVLCAGHFFVDDVNTMNCTMPSMRLEVCFSSPSTPMGRPAP